MPHSPVLIVARDDVFRSSLASALVSAGVVVDWAGDAAAALGLTRTRDYGLILVNTADGGRLDFLNDVRDAAVRPIVMAVQSASVPPLADPAVHVVLRHPVDTPRLVRLVGECVAEAAGSTPQVTVSPKRASFRVVSR